MGLNNSHKQYALRQCILVEEVDFILIQETNMTNQNFTKLADKLWCGAYFFHLKAKGALGGPCNIVEPQCLDKQGGS